MSRLFVSILKISLRPERRIRSLLRREEGGKVKSLFLPAELKFIGPMLDPIHVEGAIALGDATPLREFHAAEIGIVVDPEREFDGLPGVEALLDLWYLRPVQRRFDQA